MSDGVCNVLLVEDNPSDADLVRLMLQCESRDYRIRVAESIEAANRLAEQWQPDVVLLDLRMPDAGHLDAVERLQGKRRWPVIVLTGTEDDKLAIEALKAGAQDHVAKNGLRRDTLDRAIRYALERQRMVRELRHATTKLEAMTRIDPLTGLLNRRGLETALEGERRRGRHASVRAAALVIDLDDFKRINDSLGHTEGDEVLRELARLAGNVLRATDHLARIGGDEFLALLPGATRAAGLRTGERLRRSIAGIRAGEGDASFPVTVSIGVVEVDLAQATVEDVLRRADRFLYRSKASGKNRVTAGDDGPRVRWSRPALKAELAGGAALAPTAQPMVQVSDGVVYGYELLTRTHLEGLVEPREFFQACHEKGILVEADLAGLRASVRAARDLSAGAPIHVNLFPATLVESGGDALVAILDEALQSRTVCVEINQEQVFGDTVRLEAVVERLRDFGVRIGLDHVGNGRSSLEGMVLLRPAVVKIDFGWIRRIANTDGESRELVRLVRLVHALDAEPIVLGIETEAEAELLSRLRVRVAQGHFWSPGDVPRRRTPPAEAAQEPVVADAGAAGTPGPRTCVH